MMKNKANNTSKTILIIFTTVVVTSLVSAYIFNNTANSIAAKNDSKSSNGLVQVREPINNGEFIFGGGTYRDVNLKLKVKIPVGWSVGLGHGNGCTCQNEYETAPSLYINSNNQAIPKDGKLTSSDLIEKIYIDGSYYNNKNARGIQTPHTSFDDVVNDFMETKNDPRVESMTSMPYLLANKYKAYKFDIEYKDSIYVEGEDSKNSPMRFRTLIYVDRGNKLYTFDITNTDFFNSEKVQDMLNSVEFYE